MGIVDWDGDGVEPHEVARTAALAHMVVDESDHDGQPIGSGGSAGRHEGGCSCRAIAIAVVAVVVVLLVVALLYGRS